MEPAIDITSISSPLGKKTKSVRSSGSPASSMGSKRSGSASIGSGGSVGSLGSLGSIGSSRIGSLVHATRTPQTTGKRIKQARRPCEIGEPILGPRGYHATQAKPAWGLEPKGKHQRALGKAAAVSLRRTPG